MKRIFAQLVLCSVATTATQASAANDQRQVEVARLGADVMPFSLNATTHIFTKTAKGGVQRVVAKDATDSRQVKLVRKHLRDIQGQFLKSDYSGPSHIHGAEMPGLATLKASKPGKISVDYKDVKAGAELEFGTADAELVDALHQWFDAQVTDHGSDATVGESQTHHHGSAVKQ